MPFVYSGSSSFSRRWLGFRQPTDATADTSGTEAAVSTKKFELFPDLSEELQLHVLSFVVEAPLEESSRPTSSSNVTSTLTSVLPLVCSRFAGYCRSSSQLWWKECLERAIVRDPVWKQAATETSLDLQAHNNNYRHLYQDLYRHEIAFTGPVFVMSMDEQDLSKRYSLYLFEPRYRLMVIQLLDQHNQWQQEQERKEQERKEQQKASGDCSCDKVTTDNQHDDEASASNSDMPPPLYFLHAHQGLGHTVGDCKALLVQMVACMGMPSGHFDVTLQIEAEVLINRYWVEPGTGHLYFAQARRTRLLFQDED